MYTEMHFYISHKTQKAPPQRSLKNFQQKRKWAVVWIATLTLLARNDVSRSYCDNRRAKGLRWRRIIRAAEQAAVWLQSTVYRGMLSEGTNMGFKFDKGKS